MKIEFNKDEAILMAVMIRYHLDISPAERRSIVVARMLLSKLEGAIQEDKEVPLFVN